MRNVARARCLAAPALIGILCTAALTGEDAADERFAVARAVAHRASRRIVANVNDSAAYLERASAYASLGNFAEAAADEANAVRRGDDTEQTFARLQSRYRRVGRDDVVRELVRWHERRAFWQSASGETRALITLLRNEATCMLPSLFGPAPTFDWASQLLPELPAAVPEGAGFFGWGQGDWSASVSWSALHTAWFLAVTTANREGLQRSGRSAKREMLRAWRRGLP